MPPPSDDCIPLAAARARIDERVRPLGAEMVALDEAAGRVLHMPFVCPADRPDADRAAVDGYAVRAAATEGAGDYSPVLLAAVPVSSGTALPPDADAVLALEAVRRGGGMLEAFAPVAPGGGVERRGSELAAGATVLVAGRRLRPQDLALLAAFGTVRIAVTRRPRVHVFVPGPKGREHDALTPMLRVLIARDGGIAVSHAPGTMRQAAADADLLLLAGRSGAGPDDDAAAALAEAGGALAFHGVAMRPGGSAGFGNLAGLPVLLLPGAPLDCFAAYDLLAARAVRRLAGLRAGMGYPVTQAALGRKIVSVLGATDLVRVSIADGRAMPLGSAEAGGLASVARADGFVIVPEMSEGQAPGSAVCVHLYDDAPEGTGA